MKSKSKRTEKGMNIFVLNCGSSSLKFQIIDTDLKKIENNTDEQKAKGLVERIGGESIVTLSATGKPSVKQTLPLRDHRQALDYVLRWLVNPKTGIPGIQSLGDINAVGHRVVHGAERFKKCVLINDDIIKGIEDCIDLAPLHNPANLKGIRAAIEVFGANIPQVAIFDTAFHSLMPETSYLYAIPYQLYRRHRIRRYGFHGTSHRYVAYRYRILTGKEQQNTNVITIHLGNGCSAAAIKNGTSIDTSMGMTPLEGLVMGTRSGDIDPAIIEYLVLKEAMSITEVDTLLNKQSGLLGLSGLTNDMRDLLAEEKEHNDRRAKLAIDIFCLRVKKYIGSYLAEMNGADAIIFTGGIGENAPDIRSRICSGLDWLGIEIDDELNKQTVFGKEGDISKKGTKVHSFVIPTNEELLIARDTLRCVLNVPRQW